jgi:hypothetical protein
LGTEIVFAIAILLMFVGVFLAGSAHQKARKDDGVDGPVEGSVDYIVDGLNKAWGRNQGVPTTAAHPHPEVEYDPQDPGRHKP